MRASGLIPRQLRARARWFLRAPTVLRQVEADLRAVPRSPIDEFVFMSCATRRDGLFGESYDEWRARRISKLLAVFGIDHFDGARVVELGAGHGDIGALLASLGAEVVCVDGRRENLDFGRLKHRGVPNLSFELADLDGDFRSIGKFDLVVHFGVLYHIADVVEHLHRCFDLADEMVLETVVADSTDPHHIVVVDERSEVNEEALSGRGSRPSPFYVERIAAEAGFEVERHFSADLNADGFVYDWPHTGSGDLGGWHQRRFWRLHRRGG